MSNLHSNNVLITGANGFVGSRLIKSLLKEGKEVNIIIRQSSNLSQISELINKVNVYYYDGTMECMLHIMHKSKPKLIIHLASLFISEHKNTDVNDLIKSNILFGVQMLEAMKSLGITKLINTGTSWQHYQNKEYNPVNLYASTKQAFEDILRYYVETSNLQVITLKLYDTYGPRDPRAKLLSLLINNALSGEKLLMTPGEQLIDLVHIDDVVSAFVTAGNYIFDFKQNMDSYAISSGNQISVKLLVEIFSKVINKKLNVEWGGRSYKEREVFQPWNHGKTLPGWCPEVNLEEGLSSLWQDSINL